MSENNKKEADKNNDKLSPSEILEKNKMKDKDEHVVEAREEAMDDIAQDADLSVHSPNDDLDEGETARLGEDKTDLV